MFYAGTGNYFYEFWKPDIKSNFRYLQPSLIYWIHKQKNLLDITILWIGPLSHIYLLYYWIFFYTDLLAMNFLSILIFYGSLVGYTCTYTICIINQTVSSSYYYYYYYHLSYPHLTSSRVTCIQWQHKFSCQWEDEEAKYE